tara:strand:+ start:4167 stop:4949 length:783 start_codon:yes stop_codon:yes gene_type:complete
MDLGIKGKYAVVTGGTHGIGLATALRLAGEGCNIAVCSRTNNRINSAIELIQKFQVKCIGMQVDVLKPETINKFCDFIIKKWGSIDILVNNVGGGGRWGNENIEQNDDNVWIDVYNKNAMAAVRFTKFFIPYMKKQKWGRVITVASRYGREGGGRPWFNMANSAEISLMKTLSLNYELARANITFNSVSPGGIEIKNTGWDKEKAKNPEKFDKMIDKDFPMGRMGTPEEVADVITFLCSANATLVSGASIPIDGGESKAF